MDRRWGRGALRWRENTPTRWMAADVVVPPIPDFTSTNSGSTTTRCNCSQRAVVCLGGLNQPLRPLGCLYLPNSDGSIRPASSQRLAGLDQPSPLISRGGASTSLTARAPLGHSDRLRMSRPPLAERTAASPASSADHCTRWDDGEPAASPASAVILSQMKPP